MTVKQRVPASLAGAALCLTWLLAACGDSPDDMPGDEATAGEVPGDSSNQPDDDGGTSVEEPPGSGDLGTGEQDDDHSDAWSEEDRSQAELVEPAEQVEAPIHHTWSDYEVLDDSTLRIYFVMGNPECYGAQYEAEDYGDEVGVAVLTGRLPGAGECTDEGHLAAVDVPLEEPLSDREVVDLAEDRP